MFARTVVIDGRVLTVFCTPRTPLSEVLRRASCDLEREEAKAREDDPDFAAYRAAVKACALAYEGIKP